MLLRKELSAIGNNYNQMIRRLNSLSFCHEVKTWLGGGSYLSGDIQPGDILLLATDALAHFILLQALKNGKPKIWKHLQKLLYTGDDAAFKAWVEARRRKNQMKNDDTTLIMINF